MGVVDDLNKNNLKKSYLKKSKKIDNKTWKKGQKVICKMQEETFKAEIIGFYENSAVVNNAHNKRLYCCSFRNMFDLKTKKALKETTLKEHISTTFKPQTAYLPDEKERDTIRKEVKANEKTYKPKTNKKYRTIMH